MYLQISSRTDYARNENIVKDSLSQFELEMRKATIARTKGYFNVSKQLFLEILKNYPKDIEKHRSGMIYGNLGVISFDLGDYDESIEYFEQAIEIFGSDPAFSRFELQCNILIIISLVELNKVDEAYAVYNAKVKDFEITTKVLKHYCGIAEAVLLQTNKSLASLTQAKNILDDIINDEVLDYEASSDAVCYLSNILLEIYEMTHVSSILDEVENHAKILFEWGKSQEMNQYMVDGSMILAKLERIKLLK